MKHKSDDYKISAVKYYLKNKERPNYLSRSNNSSGSLDELPKPKFTRSVNGKPY